MRLRFLALSLFVFILLTGTGFSQTFTGTLDGYWSYNANKPIVGGQRTNDYRAFDTKDQTFALNYGELAVDYKPNKVGIRVDLGFGDAADIVHYNEVSTWRHFQQAYLTLDQGKVTFDFGKFVTPIGAEVIETKDNWNYSRSLLFTYAIPFYHAGVRATHKINDKATLAGYVVNGWDNVKDNNTAKSVIASGIFKPHQKLTIATNFMIGKENAATDDSRRLYDGTITFDANDSLSFMANYDFGQDKGNELLPGVSGPQVEWQGIAAYAKAKLADKLTLVSRYEWFDDRQGFRTGTTQELQSYTATARIPVQDAMFWAEYRRDWSNADSFHTTSSGIFGPIQGIRGYQNTFTLGLTYGFTKEVK